MFIFSAEVINVLDELFNILDELFNIPAEVCDTCFKLNYSPQVIYQHILISLNRAL